MITVTITTPEGRIMNEFDSVEEAERAFSRAYEAARQVGAGRVTHVQFNGPRGPIMTSQWPPRTADDILTPLDEEFHFQRY